RPPAAELARIWSAAGRHRTPFKSHAARVRVLAAGVLAVAGLALITAVTGTPGTHSAPSAAWRSGSPVGAALNTEPVSCQVTYRVTTDDGQRFAGGLTVRNTGSAPIPPSTVGLT